MAENLEILNTAASLLIRAVLLAARFSGRVRRRSLERLAAMDIDAKAIVADCLSRGVLVNATSERVLRFVPPLIITQQEIDRVLEILSAIFNQRALAEKDTHH